MRNINVLRWYVNIGLHLAKFDTTAANRQALPPAPVLLQQQNVHAMWNKYAYNQ
jgi:hypothetical protein